MKKLGIVLLIIVVVIGGLCLAKNIVVKAAVTTGVKTVTGLDLGIKKMNIGFLNTLVGIEGVKLYNPPQFTDRVMVDLPEIYVDYNLGAFLKKQVHLEEVRLNLKEFVVVKNADGSLNLDALTSIKPPAKEEKKPPKEEKRAELPEFKVDLLQLKIGKVILKDYTAGTPPKVSEYKINIDERYENITDPKALASIVVFKALSKSALGKLLDFDVATLGQSVKGTLEGTAKMATQAVGKTAATLKESGTKTIDTATEAAKKAGEEVGDAFKETGDTLKQMLPFGN